MNFLNCRYDKTVEILLFKPRLNIVVTNKSTVQNNASDSVSSNIDTYEHFVGNTTSMTSMLINCSGESSRHRTGPCPKQGGIQDLSLNPIYNLGQNILDAGISSHFFHFCCLATPPPCPMLVLFNCFFRSTSTVFTTLSQEEGGVHYVPKNVEKIQNPLSMITF